MSDTLKYYVRHYRDSLSAALTRFAVARSIVGVAVLGGWITTTIDPHIWAAVIVLVQIVEALQRAVPYGARFTGTNDLCAAFDALFIDALLEWEEIAAGRMVEEEITKRWGRLMTLRLAADRRALPHGLPRRPKLEKLPAADAKTYLRVLSRRRLAWPTQRWQRRLKRTITSRIAAERSHTWG